VRSALSAPTPNPARPRPHHPRRPAQDGPKGGASLSDKAAVGNAAREACQRLTRRALAAGAAPMRWAPPGAPGPLLPLYLDRLYDLGAAVCAGWRAPTWAQACSGPLGTLPLQSRIKTRSCGYHRLPRMPCIHPDPAPPCRHPLPTRSAAVPEALLPPPLSLHARNPPQGYTDHPGLGTVAGLLEDVADSVGSDDVGDVLAWLSAREATFREARDPKTPLLRLCNRLLGRISRASEPQTCAAVLVFLAKVLPLNERSGLNVMVRGRQGGVKRGPREARREGAAAVRGRSANVKRHPLKEKCRPRGSCSRWPSTDCVTPVHPPRTLRA
jgi:hypothetical protein